MRDTRHPWFAPLHRRVLTLMLCIAWLVYEGFQGDPFWLVLAFGTLGYAVWALFIAYRPPEENGSRPRA